jgi:hypothetical protein
VRRNLVSISWISISAENFLDKSYILELWPISIKATDRKLSDKSLVNIHI